ncbi:MAG: hypothetical protein P8X79_22325 [Reinekea sp.]
MESRIQAIDKQRLLPSFLPGSCFIRILKQPNHRMIVFLMIV